MGLTTEIWTRPGDASYGRVIDGIPDVYQTLHDTFNGSGDGSLQIPATYDRFDEVLNIDEATPSNTYGSTVKVFDTADMTTPIFEWLPSQIVPSSSKFDLNVDVFGFGINSIMSYARVEAYDWDGSDDWIPSVADWEWGGDNILSNPGFEQGGFVTQIWELEITATGGTYTITDGTDTTSAINFDAQASAIETRLQTDIAAIDDVAVTGTSVAPYRRTINAVDPPIGLTLTINTGSLTGGSGTLTNSVEGETALSAWNANQYSIFVGAGGVGANAADRYPVFERTTDQAHSGSYSLAVRPPTIYPLGGRNPGIAQLVGVKPGQTYQLTGWIYPTDASDTFQIGVFGSPGDDELEVSPNQTSLTLNAWNEVVVNDIVVPDDITEVRVAAYWTNRTNTTYDGGLTYFDDFELNEGLLPDTAGAIVGALYDDAVSDHSAVRIVWEDLANPGSPYLTLDFTDSVDSNGDAWFVDDVSIKLWMRMSYQQVLDQLAATLDIEWRVVADDVETGQYKLQMYNPGGMATDYSAAAGPAIQGASQDVRRSILRFLPRATNHLVEGESRITARRDTTGLEAAIGRIEGNVLDRQAPSIEAAQETAFVAATEELSNSQPYQYDLVDPQDRPLYAYTMGDILNILDPPDVDDTARLIDVEIVDTPQQTIYSVQFVPTTAAGS